MTPHESAQAVTLANCDREPIHIPGQIQSHGALFAFDAQGMTTHISANATALLGARISAVGATRQSVDFDGHADVHALLDEAQDGDAADGQAGTAEACIHGQVFDVVVHRSGGNVIAEFEVQPAPRADAAQFAVLAHRAMDRLKRQTSVDGLLALAASAVRQLTGFDRVMAYRFRHDDSGDVVAEDRHEALEPFVGRRYPASDIPTQARRLYTISTLRLIADVNATPVPVVAASAALLPLDMSHGVLRSVSPIHIEYLRNMGVGASMSISIVINGRLWGMLACHHRTPYQVPYAVRMACDVLAQLVAANAQSLLSRARSRRASAVSELRSRLIESALHADDPVPALVERAGELQGVFEAHAVIVCQEAKLHVHGDLPREHALRIVQWLNREGEHGQEPILAVHALANLPSDLASTFAPWCGLLALRFDDLANGWLVLVRKEQVETILWGGKPDKDYDNGPLGPRLTPRGSFDVWKETVRGTSVPWTTEQIEFARMLRDELLRVGATRLAEIHRARTHLLAMLGHDLRDPLQSIAMAGKLLERGGSDDTGTRMGQRITSSSGRMARLIGQVLDVSRLQSGGGLQLHRVQTDLARVLADLLDEALLAYPGVAVIKQLPPSLSAHVDPDRMAQLFTNLLSNARHHGTAGEAIRVTLALRGDEVQLEVRNHAAPIDPALLPSLFSAFKPQAAANVRNKGGLGLGLHIAQAIANGHGGSIAYSHDAPHVVFTVRFPAAPLQRQNGSD